MDQVTLPIIKSKDEILKALFQSKISNSVIGINAKPLGPGTYMTSVVKLIVEENNETTVVLKGYDLSGYFFDRSSISLDDIESVIPFTAIFGNPFLRDIEREASNNSLKLKIS